MNFSNVIGAMESSHRNSRRLKEQASLEQKKFATTVRFEREERAFLEECSKALGISLQAFLGMCLKFARHEIEGLNFCPKDASLDRLLEVYKVHNIALCNTPSLFKKGKIKRSDYLKGKNHLSTLVDYEVIETLSDIFKVNKKWLQGERYSRKIIPLNKGSQGSPEVLLERIYDLQRKGKEVSLLFVGIEDREKENNSDLLCQRDILIFLEIFHRFEDFSFTSYELWDTRCWEDEGRLKDYLKCFLRISQNVGLKCFETTLPYEFYGKILVGDLFIQEAFSGLTRFCHPQGLKNVLSKKEETPEEEKLCALYTKYFESFERGKS